MTDLKAQLQNLCANLIQQRIDNAQQAVDDSDESANEETKSSAGDKYEVGREMMQQEKDRSMAQLIEATKLLSMLKRISTTPSTGKAAEGSVVLTDSGNFYISVSAGSLTLEGKSYVAVSAASPIGAKLVGTAKGDEFSLNGKSYKITEVI